VLVERHDLQRAVATAVLNPNVLVLGLRERAQPRVDGDELVRLDVEQLDGVAVGERIDEVLLLAVLLLLFL
jgi:hypothetical protein